MKLKVSLFMSSYGYQQKFMAEMNKRGPDSGHVQLSFFPMKAVYCQLMKYF